MNVQERTGVTTMKGQPVTLLGPDVKPGDAAPDFQVVDRDFKPVKLSDFTGKTVVLSVVPSLDTPVCAKQTKRMDSEAQRLAGKVVILTVSEDLPFAQTRWCQQENVHNLQVVSDTVWRDFGQKYGLLIKDRALLARSVFVISPDGRVVYREIVPDISKEPNYEKAMDVARGL